MERTCERCGQPLAILARSHARYCSARCRMAASRARRAVPEELRTRRRWVRRTEDKRPVSARSGRPASVVNPRTWARHDEAVRSRHGVGIGYVLREGDGIVVLDLDHCVWGDRLADWAQAIVDRCPDTYIELSASGRGLHIWGRGELPDGRGRRIRRPDGTAVELYDRGRYVALGTRWKTAPLVLADLTDLIATVLENDRTAVA